MLPSDLGLPARFSSFVRGAHPYRLDQEPYIVRLVSAESRFRVLAAPPGSGKSLIYAGSLLLDGGRGLILVKTKALQTQLEEELGGLIYSIVGHANYPCKRYVRSSGFGKSTEEEEDDAVCPLPPDECSYRRACDAARKSQIVVTNYAHWVALARVGEVNRLGTFDFLVCDEAHNILDQMTDLLAIELQPYRISQLLGLEGDLALPGSDASPFPAWVEWAKHLISLPQPDTADATRLRKLYRLRRNLRRFVSSAGKGRAWAIEREPPTAPHPDLVKLSPVWCADTVEPYLFRGIEKICLTSATISRKTLRYLDVERQGEGKPDGFMYWEVPSIFDPRRRPFYIWPTIALDKRTTDAQMRLLVSRVDLILDAYPEVKGLLQSVSYDRAFTFLTMSRNHSRLLTHRSRELAHALQRFRKSPDPLVLCSPAIDEGVSFPHDECRFAILPKVPFLYSPDPVVKLRTKDDKGWANNEIVNKIEQMYGRGMRAPDDWCTTWMLDKHFGFFAPKVVWHKWFRDAWAPITEMPAPPLPYAA